MGIGQVRREAAARHRSVPGCLGCDQPWPWSFSTSPPPTNIQAAETSPRECRLLPPQVRKLDGAEVRHGYLALLRLKPTLSVSFRPDSPSFMLFFPPGWTALFFTRRFSSLCAHALPPVGGCVCRKSDVSYEL